MRDPWIIHVPIGQQEIRIILLSGVLWCELLVKVIERFKSSGVEILLSEFSSRCCDKMEREQTTLELTLRQSVASEGCREDLEVIVVIKKFSMRKILRIGTERKKGRDESRRSNELD